MPYFYPMRVLLLLICLFLTQLIRAQPNESKLVAVSGVVYEQHTSYPIPFATVQRLGTTQGTITAQNGFFSIVVEPGDTIQYRSIGYQPVLLAIPDTLSIQRITLMVPMSIDTVMLAEAVVYPWPSREQFREAFLALETKELNTLRMNPIPGIRKVDNPIPIAPHPFWNAPSYFYEEVFLKTLDKLPKKKTARTLPKWE